MKQLLFIIIYLSSATLFCQSIEIVGGLNTNNFYNSNKYDGGHFASQYTSGLGYTFGVAYETKAFDTTKLKLRLRFTLSYNNYSGKLEVRNGGNGGSNTTIADINKSIISLSIFPINFKIKNRVDLNFGFEISKLITENFQGTSSGWVIGQTSSSYDLQEKYDSFSASTYLGLRARIAYDIHITKSIIISPQYSYYLGLSGEFDEFPDMTKSRRHYFCIGIEKKI